MNGEHVHSRRCDRFAPRMRHVTDPSVVPPEVVATSDVMGPRKSLP